MFKILGCNDDQTTCDKCGRSNLKKTVVLDSDQFGIVRYGVDCAATSLLGNKKASSKGIIDRRGQVIEYAKKCLAFKNENGYLPLEKIASKICNSFGYSCEAKSGSIRIQFDDCIAIIFRDGSINYKSRNA